MNEWTIKPDVSVAPSARSPVPSLWLVAGLLVLHQLALTIIHYGIGPAMGFAPASAGLVAATIVIAALLILMAVAIDTRTPGRAAAILLPAPRWNARVAVTMLIGLGIAQIPLGILALQGATVWQNGAGSDLEVGRALLASLATSSGVVLLLATVLVAPAVEELLYRGYLIGALVDRVPAFVAVAVSALLFVTLHFEPANLVASLCLGLGAAFCAVRTRSIWPGLIVHVASNSFGMWYATLG